jgi:hypothetical protein
MFLVGDLILSCIPVCIIYKLSISLQEKLIICFLMCLGILATCAVIPKYISIYRLSLNEDLTWQVADVDMWSMLELSLGIITASVPTLKSLFEGVVVKTTSRWTSSSTSTDR